MQKLKQKGIAMMLVIFITTILLVIGTTLARIVFSSYTHTSYRLAKLKAFYLAEAAIEYGKVEIANNVNWYTDLTVTDPEQATGKRIGEGKIIREQGENVLYGIGYKDRTKSIIKITFQSLPFKQLSWEEI